MTLFLGIGVLIGLLLPFAAGYTLLRFLFRKNRLPLAVSCALSYGLGMGLLTQIMLILGIVGIRYRLVSIAPFLVLSTILFGLLTSKVEKGVFLFSGTGPCLSNEEVAETRTSSRIFWDILCGLAWMFVIYNIFYVFWRALNIPIYTWDAIATTAFRGKIIFFEQSISYQQNFPYPSYPLHVPFMECWMALNLGVWDDQLIKIIFPCALLSFVIVHNYFLSCYTNKQWALLGTVILLSSNLLILHGTIGYRDVFFLYYECTVFMLLLLWRSKKNDAFLILASLFAGFATFTKLEGTAFLIIHAALFSLILLNKRKSSLKWLIRKSLLFTIPSFGICGFYYAYKIFSRFPSSGKTEFDFTLSSLERIPVILNSFGENFFLSGNWNLVWFILAVSLAMNGKRLIRNMETRLLFIALVLSVGMYTSMSLLTTMFIWISGSWNIAGLSRLVLHFFPLASLLIVLLNYRDKTAIQN